MTPDKRREIARLGGKAAHQKGRAHQFTSNEAREAGRKGGLSVSRNRAHMAEIGRAGGKARGLRAGAGPEMEAGMMGEGAQGSPDAMMAEGASVLPFRTQAIEQALSDLSFPARKSLVIERAGDQTIETSDHRDIPVRELLSHSGMEEFGSLQQVTQEIGRLVGDQHAA